MTPSPVACASIDTPAIREAGRDLLSLALMDARNHTLQILGRFEDALGPALQLPQGVDASPPLWVAGHAGWLAEYWIARNPKRGLGAACPPDSVRLASIDPMADHCFNPLIAVPAERTRIALPQASAVRAYLLETLETTLELLAAATDDDAGLHFFRMALFHEDLCGEQLAVLAQRAGVPLGLPLPSGAAQREPMVLPASRWRLGWKGGGFAVAAERGAEEVDVPEFDIDSQPVSWAQYVEFIDDGGYDRPELWRNEGWRWLEAQAQAEGRRGPRYVEQIGVASGAVLQSLFGKPARMGATQSAMHVTWWEADAYARWAGRRLATEVEWDIAAHAGERRGFRWGDVREWTAGSLRLWPGSSPDAWGPHAEYDAHAAVGQARVQRGASFAARARSKHVSARHWAKPDDDTQFAGFRTCSA